MDASAITTTACVALICGLLGVTVPWLALLVSRGAAAVAAGIFATLGTTAFVLYNAALDGNANIRADLLIIPPLLLAAWAVCIGLSISAFRWRANGRASVAEPAGAADAPTE